MDQGQFKVSYSLRFKLLTSIVVLLILVIAFLNLSSYVLFRNDKVAYVYQSQNTEAILAGKEFTNAAARAIDTLRQSLGAIDPHKVVTERQKNQFKDIVNNQSRILESQIMLLPKKGVKLIARATQKKSFEQYKKKKPSLRTKETELRRIEKQLRSAGFAFLNLLEVGVDPAVLGIVIADTNRKDHPKGMPIAIGFVPLSFMKDIQGANVSIADKDGWILFDTTNAGFQKANVAKETLFSAATKTEFASGTQEYENEGKTTLGSYFKPGFDVVALSRTPLEDAMKATYELSIKFVLLGLMAIGAAIVFAILFAKTLTSPLLRLYNATREVAVGNFDLKVDKTSNDEIGALTGSFNLMSKKIGELIEESMEKVRLEGELAIASTVQQTLIPPAQFRDDKILIRSHYESASECGGDWWGSFRVGNKTALLIADATGHGLPSALITASARSCFSVIHKLASEDPNFSMSPSKMLALANRAVHETSLGKIMMTFFASVVDHDTGEMVYASAGHNPPWLFAKSESGYKMKSLVAKGKRLGDDPENQEWPEKTVTIGKEDILFLYTDGILEGTNTDGAMYGKKQMKKIVESTLVGGPELVISSLVKDFQSFSAGKPLDDDVTLAAASLVSN